MVACSATSLPSAVLGRITVRVRRRVTALEPHLMRTQAAVLHEKAWIELHSSVLTNVQLDQPAADSVWIKLLIPRAIEGVGEVHALAVAADLHHLRPAVRRAIGMVGMRLPPHHSSDPHRSGLPGIERIGNVILPKLACSPAGNVQKAVVEREVDVRQ